jgi:hypothetical protein
MRNILMACVAVLGPLFLAACATDGPPPPKYNLEGSAAEVASTHLATISVERWEDAKDSLTPAFSLTGDGALTEAITATSTASQRTENSLAAGVSLAVTGPQITKNDTRTTDATGTTQTSTTQRQLSTPAAPTAPSTSVSGALGVPDAASGATGTGTEPVLNYTAANALFQEVQLLNRSMNAITKRKGYDAYVVRLQLTLLPLHRAEPYDTFVDLSFLPKVLAPTPPSRLRDLKEVQADLDRRVGEAVGKKQAELAAKLPPDQRAAFDAGKVSLSPPEKLDVAFRIPELASMFEAVDEGGTCPKPDAPGWRPADLELCKAYSALPPADRAFRRQHETAAAAQAKARANFNLQIADPGIVRGMGGTPDAIRAQCAAQPADSVQRAFCDQYLASENQNLIVVPLLSTDSLEGTLQSDAYEYVRQLSATLSAAAQSVGASASLSKLLDNVTNSQALRTNSLFSIGKNSDGTIRVRLGANRFGNVYETIPRTHYISLVVLAPKAQADQEVRVLARSTFFDASRNGAQLGMMDTAAYRARAGYFAGVSGWLARALEARGVSVGSCSDGILASCWMPKCEQGYQVLKKDGETPDGDYYRRPASTAKDDYQTLLNGACRQMTLLTTYVTAGDYLGFRTEMANEGVGDNSIVEGLWADLLSPALQPGLASDTFSLPSRPPVACHPGIVTVADDGKSATATISGCAHVKQIPLVVSLWPDPSKTDEVFRAVVTPSADDVGAVTFPTHQALAFDPPPAVPPPAGTPAMNHKGKIQIEGQTDPIAGQPLVFTALYLKPPTPKAAMTVSTTATAIVVNDGKGQLNVGLKAADATAIDSVVITGVGGDIVLPTGSSLTPTAGQTVALAAKTGVANVTIQFTNLAPGPGRTLTLSVQPMKGGKPAPGLDAVSTTIGLVEQPQPKIVATASN